MFNFAMLAVYKINPQYFIFYVIHFIHFGQFVIAITNPTNGKISTEMMTVDEYNKIYFEFPPLLPLTKITCDDKKLLPWYKCTSNYSNVEQDKEHVPGCNPSMFGCCCIKFHPEEPSLKNENKTIEIFNKNETQLHLLRSSSSNSLAIPGDTIDLFLYFTAPCCKTVNLTIECTTSRLMDTIWQQQFVTGRETPASIVKLSLTFLNIQESDAGIYEMTIQVDNVTVSLAFYISVSLKNAAMRSEVYDYETNKIHESLFWQPWKLYKVRCRTLTGGNFAAFIKDCLRKVDCKWTQIINNQSFVIVDTALRVYATLIINATKSFQSYRIAYGNNTCIEGEYYPSYVPNSISMEPTHEAFINETIELHCRYDKNYLTFSHWIIKYPGTDLIKAKLNESSGRYAILKTKNETESVHTLMVLNATTADSGVYGCFFNINDDKTELTINVTNIYSQVNVSKGQVPYFVATSNQTIRVTNENLHNLQCVGKGHPTPQTTWYDKMDNFIGNGTEIPIPPTSSLYRCEISNKFGVQSKTFTIIGKEKSKLMVITVIVLAVVILLLIFVGSIFAYREIVQQRKLKSSLSDLQRLISSPDTSLQDLLPSLQLFTSAAENRLYINPKTFIKEQLLTVERDIKLGKGCFGLVYKGLLKCDYQSDPLPVAVKTPKLPDISHFEALIAELTIMSNIGSHINLLGVYGAVIEGLHLGQLFVVFEICEKGSLLSYIKSKCFVDEFTLDYQNANFDRSAYTLREEAACLSDNVGYPFSKTNIFTCNLLQYGYQIADGMDYISRYVVHRDLALRNMLLTNNQIVKIADFGLALDKVFNPKVSNADWLPIKWMPPEAICRKEFSTHSDVWSFGVVLWELFTLGQKPFEDYHVFDLHSMESFCNQLKSGKKLNCPPYSPSEIYTLMEKCWSINISDRPSFEECKRIIGCYLSQKFPSASEVLINLLKNSQPYVDVKQSQIRQTIPYENFTYLTSKKENVYISDNAED